MPEPDHLSEDACGINDFYFGSKDWEYPMGHISFVGKLDAITLRAGAPAIAPWIYAGTDGQAFAGLLADLRGSARSEQPRDAEPRWRDRAVLHAEQRRSATST